MLLNSDLSSLSSLYSALLDETLHPFGMRDSSAFCAMSFGVWPKNIKSPLVQRKSVNYQ